MMTEERKRSDEAWAKALPIVQKEAREGRPYIPWAGRPYDLPQADIPSFPGAEGGGMMQTVIMGIVNIVFTLVAIFTVDRFGRKPLLIIGSIGMAVGAFAVAMCDSMGIKGIVPVLSVIVYAAFFMMSWGPICWVLISEIFPNTIRGKAVAIAVAFQWIFNYIISSTFPALYDFSPMFAYSLYGIICVAAAFFVWRWVPETKGKTLEDMSKLWRKNK